MKKLVTIFIMVISLSAIKAQVTVVNNTVMPYNITPESLLSASLNNPGTTQNVSLVVKLFNLNNDLLLTVSSSVFPVKPGFNVGFNGTRKVASVEYSLGNQASYIKTTHTLPSGVFRICIQIINVIGSEPYDYWDEIQSDFNQYLYLVYPGDKESISTTTPVLTWSHSEPFNILSSGEFFRMTVAEIKENQSPEEALLVNSPVMLKDYVTTHNLQYPYEAKPLIKGKRYAWNVSKIGNGTVLNKTETWEFKIIGTETKTDGNYFTLRKELDGSYYRPENGKLLFKFDEEYKEGLLSCIILNDEKQIIAVKAKNRSEKKDVMNFKQIGSTQYEIDLEDYDLGKGFYILQVKNTKNEVFVLKFYID